jgi:hypothetical protein
MNDNFFDDESAHSMLMYWWHGVIVDDKYWAGCTNDDVSNEYSKIHFADKLESRPRKGWGKRYKVSIIGRHYAIKGNPDEADLLEMAEVVYPVTAGSGLGGTKQTAALKQGAHVIGFYADGKEGRNPVILGCFGVNEQNEPNIFQGDPTQFFQLRTANKGQCGEKLKPVPEKDQNLEKDKKPIEANASPQQASQAHKTKVEDGNVKEPIYKPTRCEQPADIINNIKLLLEKLSYYTNLAKGGASDLISSIDGIIKSVTRAISGLTNTLLDRARGYLINLINNGIKDVMNLFPPFLRPGFNLDVQGALNGLGCAFNKIKDKVLGVVQNLAKQFIDNYVNAPLCAATSFLGGLLGNVLGEINGAVDTAVSAINSIINIGTGFADKTLDVLDFVLNLLGFFECDTNEKKCPDTTQWSFWNGPKDVQANIEEGVSRTVQNIIDEVETVLPGSEAGAAALPCNSRQVPCGPPQVKITGGGGSGAQANAVVSATGAILGLDFSAFGSEYTYEPQIILTDSCGTGGGAVFQPIMEPTGTFNQFNEEILNLVGAIPIDSGSQYLPAPNGTTGGAGFIFSQPSDTILFKTGTTQTINGREVSGAGYEVYPCGTTFSVVPGDEVYTPSGTIASLFGVNGEVQQTIRGLGPLTKITIEAAGTITAPCNPENVPTLPPVTIPISSGETTIGGGTSTIPSIPNPTATTGQPQTVPGATFTPGTILPATGVTATGSGFSNIPQPTSVQGIPLPTSVAVVAILDQVFITNPGFGFTSTDTITIIGNKGAELEFTVNERGEVTSVNVINGGLGFDEVPFITIQSQTGFNFEAVPIFRFIPLSSIDLNNITIPTGSRIISVVDCVGKYNE